MRIVFLLIFLFGILSVHAQDCNDGEEESLLSQIIESSQEYAEFRRSIEKEATGWLIARYPEYNNFQISLLSANKMDSLYMQNLRYCSFAVSPEQKEAFVMVCMLDQPYQTNEKNLKIKEIRKEQWKNYLFEYLRAAVDSSLIHPDSIAVYRLTSGYNSKRAEKLWARTLKQHPEYAKSRFEKIRLNNENNRYEYLYGIFGLEQISSISKKGIGFRSNVYSKEVRIPLAEIREKHWINRDCGDCKVVHSISGMNILYSDNAHLIPISSDNIVRINALLLNNTTE